MAKFKKNVIKIVALLGATSFASGFAVQSFQDVATNGVLTQASSYVRKTSGKGFDSNIEDYFDSSVVQKLPDTVDANTELSVIVDMGTETVMDAYEKSSTNKPLHKFVISNEGKTRALAIAQERNALLAKLNKSGIKYTLGEEYDTILSGFEITIKGKDFEKLSKLFYGDAELIVGEVYERCESQIVNNDVDVYDTGIFDTSSSKYQGAGVVVAVLDTGLDYTHTAFSVDNFNADPAKDAFTLDDVSRAVSSTEAAKFTTGLTGQDVYLNRKVPFAYDYADKDPDVLPINSEHGTHVAGVIAGNDETITGVAPEAQLAIMKVFSDTADGAKDSWIMAAVEDCVTLGVDVINMSLGSACGFSREVDKEHKNDVYDRVREAGISLIAAAANDYNATHGSTKNGSNGLTSNPDSGTVGAPSTYTSALSVASVDGVKTPYLTYKGQIIYFNEATTSDTKKKKFVDDILKTVGEDVQSHTFEYITIPGTGVSSDYDDSIDYTGKIALVRRGISTFEDKVRTALVEKGAAGIIIYNNVSGTISMSVGAEMGAVCSISQDEGELLASAGTGTITISRDNVAGPFMSDFSSWGPTSDLKIKPEITAHGGEILSAIPGQGYDRLSGTSMAAPNQAGATALIRQYVKYSGTFGTFNDTAEDARKVTALVNQLMMSTTDIVYNKNGLPFAVRKQGSGLVNITKATTSQAYLTTFEKGEVMDKTKLELGDDKERKGVYEMTFAINNISGTTVSYDIDTLLMTEGVSTTYTSHGDQTVTMEGYQFKDTQTDIVKVENGSATGNLVSVSAGQTATVTLKVTLSDKAKQYMNDSFEYGMYVEGFVTLTAKSGATVNMNIPVLAFYGDWTEAPIFDEEYYDTHKDEINAGLDDEDKVMPDAYATRAIGSLYSDYITTLGTYYFEQDPSATKIAADKKYIALSNIESDTNFTVCGIYGIWAGLLRNVKQAEISIVEDATGIEIFNKKQYNLRKSYSSGSTVYQGSIDMDFKTLEYNLKNNTQYTVTITTFIDYEGEQSNARNVFEFPLYIDFQAPIVTDVQYRSVYDKVSQTTKLYADLSVYDNHYAMGMQLGQIIPYEAKPGEEDAATFTMDVFGKYVTPVYSSYNATTQVTIELTDYVERIKDKSITASYDDNGNLRVVDNSNTFIVICYDYAMNSATYEIELPDDILAIHFTEENIEVNPYETLDLTSILEVFPGESWVETLNYEISNETLDTPVAGASVVSISNHTLLATNSGTATLTAVGYDKSGKRVTASIDIHVLGEGDEGYYGNYTPPEVSKFELTGYKTLKAFYSVDSSDRDIGFQGNTYSFGNVRDKALEMYPSEKVAIICEYSSFYRDRTKIVFDVGDDTVATVSENGEIVGVGKGTTFVSVDVYFWNEETEEYETTSFSDSIRIDIKDPFTSNMIYLMSYKGDEEVVEIPGDRGITTIYSYAFTGYEYIEKDLANGDVIDEEDPYNIKQWYRGENSNVKKVIIPKGVTHINSYAFTAMSSLEEVVLPDTLTTIGVGAFMQCTKLKKINLENVKFINEKAFYGCGLQQVDLSGVVAIGNYTFANCLLTKVTLPKSSQSLGIGAFAYNKSLGSVSFEAKKIKIGANVFAGCTNLTDMYINSSVIASKAFYGCENLNRVTLGKDVEIISEFAFTGTAVDTIEVEFGNPVLKADADAQKVYKGEELVMVAPKAQLGNYTLPDTVTSIASGAFAGNTQPFTITGKNVKAIGAYAFAECSNLSKATFDNLEEIGDYAFYKTALTATPKLNESASVGAHAFDSTKIRSVTVADNMTIGEYAFANNSTSLSTVVIGNGVTLGDYAFYSEMIVYTVERNDGRFYQTCYDPYIYEVRDENGQLIEKYNYFVYNFETVEAVSTLVNVTLKNDVVVGSHAFEGNSKLSNLVIGNGAKIGDYAFYNARSLANVNLNGVTEIGDYAFTGETAGEIEVYSVTLKDENNRNQTNNYIQYAYEREYVNGKNVIIGLKYTHFAPMLTTIDLSSATKIGQYAFAYNDKLTSLTIGENITEISDYAFYDCKGLTMLPLDGSNVTKIGEGAFYRVGAKEADLTGVSSVGNNAFARSSLEKVSLKSGASLGEGAFDYSRSLKTVENMGAVSEIGAYAFRESKITEVDLTSATVIGAHAFQSSLVSRVTLGKPATSENETELKEIGANPFAGCPITTFAREEKQNFYGQEVGTAYVTTYDVSAKVKVIDDVIYAVVPNGLQLIAYPALKQDASYTVQEGTVKISARAFESAKVKNVTLASTLASIGDKAFYGCDNLAMVVFQSYQAPILEEEFDTSYISMESLAMTGRIGGGGEVYEGLGISKFYMWNSTSTNNFYYGANFVDFIGRVKKDIVMVKPANGVNYDSFVLAQYFTTSVDGSNAADETTLWVIALINSLPDTIELEHESQIVEAREAYDALNSEQKDIVDKTNLNKLTSAEQALKYLKRQQSNQDNSSAEPTVQPSEGMPKYAVVLLIMAGVVLVGGAGVIIFLMIRRRRHVASLPMVEQADEVATTEETDEQVQENDNQQE